MIVGVGIDSIEVERFKQWRTYTRTKLERIFSSREIDYCLSIPGKSAERFAVRYASREAFFKALCTMNTNLQIPFLAACRKIHIENDERGNPTLTINWNTLIGNDQNIRNLISLTHTKTIATALVILER